MDKKVATIYQTTNYAQFRHLTGNRDVLERRAARIKKSIADIGYVLSPIVVNEKMEVIDGQGRLMALQELGMPVDYVIAQGAGIRECIALNANTTNWTANNYVKAYAELGDTSYKYLQNLMKAYAGVFKIEQILAAAGYSGNSSTRVIRGRIHIDDAKYEQAIKILDYFKLFKAVIDRTSGRKNFYYIVLAFCYGHNDVDNDRLYRKIMERQLDLLPVAKLDQALDVIESIYNDRARHKVYISNDYKRLQDAKKRREA